MSDIVGTGTDSFCRGEDHPRSVPVPVRGVPAVLALEGPFGQPGAARPRLSQKLAELAQRRFRPDFSQRTASFHSQRHRCHSAISARSD